jgi:hypothetical protein
MDSISKTWTRLVKHGLDLNYNLLLLITYILVTMVTSVANYNFVKIPSKLPKYPEIP